MGWTSYEADIYDTQWIHGKQYNKVNRSKIKAICDKQLTWEDERGSRKVIKSSIVGNTYYAAVEHIQPDGSRRVWAAITRFQTGSKNGFGNFCYKDMDETVGPYYYDCPLSILNLLTETEYEYAKEWREKVRLYHEQQKEKRNSPTLGKLPIGTVIEFTINGKGTFRAEKKNYWKFKRPIWTDGYWRFPTSVIPDDWKVVESV